MKKLNPFYIPWRIAKDMNSDITFCEWVKYNSKYIVDGLTEKGTVF